MLAGALSGVEMGLTLAGIPHKPGIAAALESLTTAEKFGGQVTQLRNSAGSIRRVPKN